jgi:hypothetical protein
MVRCKFVVESVEPNPECGRVKLRAVYDPNPESENGKFFRWTPAGELDLQVVRPEVVAQFVEGQEFYVDLTPVAS